jgi:hypothetical protein
MELLNLILTLLGLLDEGAPVAPEANSGNGTPIPPG